MTVEFSVSFEFPTRPPAAHRGTAHGWEASTCASRAIKEAQATLRPVGWTSLVVCFLGRLPDAPEASPPPTPVADELSNTAHAQHLPPTTTPGTAPASNTKHVSDLPPRANSLRKSAAAGAIGHPEQLAERRHGTASASNTEHVRHLPPVADAAET